MNSIVRTTTAISDRGILEMRFETHHQSRVSQKESMPMPMHIDIQSTKLIKPATSTPETLRHYTIGAIDEIAPRMNVCVALFFSINNINHPKFLSELENSLEKTLPQFYPLAGRYLQQLHVVDCNDQGVEFKHAKTNIKLEQILDPKLNLSLIHEFMPSALGAVDEVTDPMLSVQLTTFECGGVALAVSVSHRIADASTVCTFLNHWASINRQELEPQFLNGPGFNSASFFPPRGASFFSPRRPPSLAARLLRSKGDEMLSKFVTKKLSFSKSEICKLKEKIIMVNDTDHWSKVLIVSALICNILIKIDLRTHGHPRDCFLVQPINLRGKTETLIPKDSCGNLLGRLVTKCESSVESTHALAHVLRDSIKNAIRSYSKVRLDNEEGQTMVMNSILNVATIPSTTNIIIINSWCNFPFYEADFGFGKPVWINTGSMGLKNSLFMTDGVGGNGVEAYVCLDDTNVPYFEEALKSFAA